MYPGSLHQSLDDEHWRHERDENVLRELCVISDDDWALKSGNEQSYDRRPNRDPDPAGQEFNFGVLGKLVQGFVEDHDGTSNAWNVHLETLACSLKS